MQKCEPKQCEMLPFPWLFALPLLGQVCSSVSGPCEDREGSKAKRTGLLACWCTEIAKAQ